MNGSQIVPKKGVISLLLFTLAIFSCGLLEGQDRRGDSVKIQIDSKTVISHISPIFIGFGYETSAVAQSNFFSPGNLPLVRLYRNLSPCGLIRVGGIISDYTEYVPDGAPIARTQKEVTVINKVCLDELGKFARATGWQVMWGLNFGTGSKEQAVTEARAVEMALDGSLQSFEIGNEVEDLRRFGKNYDEYYSTYLEYKAAIRAALPNAPFSGPDSVGNIPWITNFVSTEGGDIKLLTHHYYRGGAKDAGTSLDKLLQHDEAWDHRLATLRQICREKGLAFRINEVNSFSGGGKPGVSDTFGSALWCLDYMFILASYDCGGVNMETDINQLGFISHYSPIVHDAAGHCSARPEYYGMLAFAMAGQGEMLKIILDKMDINLSAYATRHDNGDLWITIINKDFVRDADVDAALPEGCSTATAIRLRAASIISQDHVTLAGAEVSENGIWAPGPFEKIPITANAVHFLVPHASAMLLRLSGKRGYSE